MKKYIEIIKNYLSTNSTKELIIGIAVVVGAIALIIAVVVFIQNSGTKLVYQPTVACDLLTKNEAKEMLGEQVIDRDPANPVLNGHVATSKCSYTDMNPDQNAMMVAAIAVRSGIDDKGAEQNKAEFAAGKSAQNVEIVKNVGDSAYFNPERGQLNILNGRDWIILSYGVGADPTSNTLSDALVLAQKVLQDAQLPTF